MFRIMEAVTKVNGNLDSALRTDYNVLIEQLQTAVNKFHAVSEAVNQISADAEMKHRKIIHQLDTLDGMVSELHLKMANLNNGVDYHHMTAQRVEQANLLLNSLSQQAKRLVAANGAPTEVLESIAETNREVERHLSDPNGTT